MAPPCYKGTEYFSIIRNLRDKNRNSESTEKCPKCSTEVRSYYTLLIHIEKSHPNDVKHKPYLKQSPQLEETFTQPSNDIEINNESSETINEVYSFQTNDSFTNCDSLNQLKDNPFFKVIVYFLFTIYSTFFYRT